MEIADISIHLRQLALAAILDGQSRSACSEAERLLCKMRELILAPDISDQERMDTLRSLMVENGEG